MAQAEFSTRPIYLQLRDALMQRIASGEWRPGQVIPNEGDLAREFNVSPGTMRKALGLIETERLVTRKQGRGTFVNDQTSASLVDRYCNIRGPDGRAAPGRLDAGEITEAAANAEECRRLHLRSHDQVWRIRRARIYRDAPLMYEEVSLPAELFPRLDAGKVHCRIVALAQQHGLLLGAAQERVSIGAACERAAVALGIAQGAPVVLLDRVVRTIGGQPVEWRIGQCDLASNHYQAQVS
jgi:GntR family transcriptional regulator